MIQVRIEVTVDRPSEEVFAFISNFENNPKWQSGMREAKFTSEGPLGVGSTYDQVASFLGRKVVSSFEVIDYDPGRMVKATSTTGSFPITFTRMVETLERGTRVSAIIEGDAAGFYKLAKPLLKRFVQRSVDTDYRRLKEILEAQEG